MKPPLKRGTILNSSGEPTSKGIDSVEDLNLPPGVQALIETRINAAVENLRELNRTDIRNAAAEHSKWWRYLAIFFGVATFLWSLFSWFFSPGQIRDAVVSYVDETVAKPAMQEELAKAAQQVSSTHIKPLQKSVDDLRGEALTLRTEIYKRQADLASDQKIIQAQVEMLSYGVLAKAGDAEALSKLKESVSQGGAGSVTAKIIYDDVLLFYEVERHNPAQRIIPNESDNSTVVLSVEEAFMLLDDPRTGIREAGANGVSLLGRTSSVATLVRALTVEKNLRVISRITAALEKITKSRFEPLNTAAALLWWNENKAKPQYHFDDESYAKSQEIPLIRAQVLAGFFSIKIDETNAEKLIPIFSRILEKEEAASSTRGSMIFALLKLGRVDEANGVLDGMTRTQPAYWQIGAYRASVFAAQGKLDDAATQLNEFLRKNPKQSQRLHGLETFKPLADRNDINWSPTDKFQ